MVQQWVESLNLSNEWKVIIPIIKVTVILLICVIGNWVARKVMLIWVEAFIKRSANKWDDILFEQQVFRNLSHIVPGLLLFFLVQVSFPNESPFVLWTQRFAFVYMIIVTMIVINAILGAADRIYQNFEVSRHRPIKGYLQACSLFVYFFTGIFIVSVLLNRSPWGLISIFGGLTAVLLLIFKDTILGFVASVQLSAHNMIALGDWIEMPQFGADGDVIDITIHTVKVQNWDKTITTIPTYALISQSFKNWRGMQQSGGRRIKRSIMIDMNTICFVNDEMLAYFKKFDYIKSYLEKKENELTEYNQKHNINDVLINGRRMTNVGTFRAYLIQYLKHHPKINQDMTFLVRQLEPTEKGLPMQIYVFSNDQRWAHYEAIQADIFDHILAVIPEFSLRLFQMPTGQDVQKLVLR